MTQTFGVGHSSDPIVAEALAVAAVQMKFDSTETIEARVERARTLITQAADACSQSRRRQSLVVLPELWAHGAFSYESWRTESQPVNGLLVSSMMEIAHSYSIWLHAGSIIERENDTDSARLWNTSVLISPLGEVRATYRKIHRFGFADGEPRLLTAGEHPVTTQMTDSSDRGPVVGLSTCYDLRFPELYRATSADGVELDLIPAAWPLARVEHWKALGRARAIENQRFVVQANLVGIDSGVELGGHSSIIDPNGAVLCSASGNEEILSAVLDFGELHKLRNAFPVSADRRL